MAEQHNEGEIVRDWQVPPRPSDTPLSGKYVRLERLSADRHAADLYRANSADRDGLIWKYLPYGPYSSVSGYHHWVREVESHADPHFMAMIDPETGHAGGVMSLMRIAPELGSIEVGHINIAPVMQRTQAVSEAIFLLMKWVFEAGYRRFEWKCDAANLRSRRSAERFGFSFEGVFRQHLISKGRNRDTAWFACIDKDWPALKEAYGAWLSPANFNAEGRQLESLADLTRLVRVSNDPLG
ncbi:MAG: GNAT family N-acetyltransferase [Alphaproteobacteria bacterium]|nr:GNAT family N-acetyltransferase [Alphaproteobacteria bacterium]